MYQVACPSCGAQVSFRSAASVMAVCSYCQSTLLRDAEAVRDIGKMSAVLEDYSPIQINTSGMFAGKRFTVVGRIQLVYDDGFWNEWYALFDDGSACWLSDASGKYVITQVADLTIDAPFFDSIRPGDRFLYLGNAYIACDVRTARCTAGQGELPFKVGEGWQAKVADYRNGPLFLTIDYSDGGRPNLYTGKAATLASLNCQLLRDDDQIAQSAGKLKGRVATLECPSCGASIAYYPGVAQHLVCQTCHAEVAASAGQVEVLTKNEQLSQRQTTLALGDLATINGAKWQLIGVMECRETGGDISTWVEYLLYHPQKGFQWIVESMEGWEQVEVLDDWPIGAGDGKLQYDSKVFSKLYDYGAEVTWASGAFNWRVKIGDRTSITDYEQGDLKLCAERSTQELGWSLSRKVSVQTVGEWFSNPALAARRDPISGSASDKASSLKPIAKVFTVLMLLINVPLLIWSGGAGFVAIVFGVILLWFPVLEGASRSSSESDSTGDDSSSDDSTGDDD